MNFFKQAQDFAASATKGNEGADAPAAGGFGSLMSGAANMSKTQAAPADVPAQSAEQSSLPEGRHAPTNKELMDSTQLLFGAAQGQKVENTRLAGAAEDLLGGLATHGNLGQGQYASYINQAEEYLHKYSGEDSAAAKSAPAPAAKKASGVPAESAVSEAPPAEDAAPTKPAPTKPAPSADEEAPEKSSLPTSAPSRMNDRA